MVLTRITLEPDTELTPDQRAVLARAAHLAGPAVWLSVSLSLWPDHSRLANTGSAPSALAQARCCCSRLISIIAHSSTNLQNSVLSSRLNCGLQPAIRIGYPLRPSRGSVQELLRHCHLTGWTFERDFQGGSTSRPPPVGLGHRVEGAAPRMQAMIQAFSLDDRANPFANFGFPGTRQ